MWIKTGAYSFEFFLIFRKFSIRRSCIFQDTKISKKKHYNYGFHYYGVNCTKFGRNFVYFEKLGSNWITYDQCYNFFKNKDVIKLISMFNLLTVPNSRTSRALEKIRVEFDEKLEAQKFFNISVNIYFTIRWTW